MASRKPLIDTDGEICELTAGDLAKFKSAAELLSPSREGNGACRDARKHRPKSASRFACRVKWLKVVEQVQESGDGWQTRVDTSLREWLKSHSPA